MTHQEVLSTYIKSGSVQSSRGDVSTSKLFSRWLYMLKWFVSGDINPLTTLLWAALLQGVYECWKHDEALHKASGDMKTGRFSNVREGVLDCPVWHGRVLTQKHKLWLHTVVYNPDQSVKEADQRVSTFWHISPFEQSWRCTRFVHS